jgi:hypothetical protein
LNTHKALSPIWSGPLAGLGAGLLSGFVLQQIWVLTPLPLMVGRAPEARVGWVIHLSISVIFGAVFGAIVRDTERSYGTVLVYGILLGLLVWLIGPLYLIPVLIGLPPQFALAGRWLQVGFAYVLYGITVGALHLLISAKSERRV